MKKPKTKHIQNKQKHVKITNNNKTKNKRY